MADVEQPDVTRATTHLLVKWLVAVVFLAAIAYILITNEQSIQRLKDTDFVFLVPLALATACKYGVTGKIQNEFLKEQGVHLKGLHWYALSVSTAFYNLFLPVKAGTFLRATYLKTFYGLDWTAFVRISIQKSLYLAVFTSVWAALLIWLASRISWNEKVTYSGVAVLFSALLALILFSGKSTDRLLRKFTRGRFEMKLPLKRNLLWNIFCWTFLLLALSGLEYYFGFNALNIDAGMMDCIIAGSVISLSAQFSITPGNLGIREIFASTALKIMGYALSDALLVSLVSRSVTLLVTLLLGFIANLYLAKNTNETAVRSMNP